METHYLTIELFLFKELVYTLLAVVEGVERGKKGVKECIGIDMIWMEDLKDVHLIWKLFGKKESLNLKYL